jgi:putative hydroxymethylpyrimidine transport system substrate-binding protein
MDRKGEMRQRAAPILLALAAFAACLALVACGEKSEDGSGGPEAFDLTLDFYPNPDHAGIYMAEERGFFREAGLDVRIRQPSDPSAPLKLAATGRTDLAISYQPEVVLARDQDLDVVAVGALVDRPLTSLIWTADSGLGGVADLRGKTIATAGIGYQDAYLETILARVDLTPDDVKSVNVGFGLLPAVLGGRADAMLGGFRNVEGVDLRLRGAAPTVLPVDQLGVPTYDELVFVAQGASLEEDPEAVRLFLAALARGTSAAVADPAAAAEAVLEANSGLDPRLTEAETKATLPLLGAAAERSFAMDSDRWRQFSGWMRDNGLIDSLPSSSELLTNDHLPGAIPE